MLFNFENCSESLLFFVFFLSGDRISWCKGNVSLIVVVFVFNVNYVVVSERVAASFYIHWTVPFCRQGERGDRGDRGEKGEPALGGSFPGVSYTFCICYLDCCQLLPNIPDKAKIDISCL